jgi:signal transduction histidine kinase
LPVEIGVAVCFIGAGLAAWRARPGNRVGPLMIAVGGLWALAKFPLPFAAGGALAAALVGGWAAVLAHLVVAFPAGRLTGQLPRMVVGLAYLSAVLVGLAAAVGHPAGPTLRAGGRVAAVGAGLAVIGLLLGRWRRSSAARRRSLTPVFGAMVIATGLFVALKPTTVAGAAGTALTPVLHLALAGIPVGYLAGLLRTRVDRGRVAELVVGLTRRPPPVGIERALAKALHDPSLRVGFWLPDAGHYVDSRGGTVSPPPDGQAVGTRIYRSGDPLALLVHDPALREHPELIEAACAAMALALENERLTVDLRARLRQLADSRSQLLRSTEAERRRLERDLHDGVQQRLLSIPMTLGLAESALRTGPDRALPLIREAKHATLAVLEELRGLSQGVHPPMLTERGLAGAVQELVALAPLPVALTLELPGQLPPEIETTAYYVVAEALANVTKHAEARHAQVRIARRAECADGGAACVPHRPGAVRGRVWLMRASPGGRSPARRASGTRDCPGTGAPAPPPRRAAAARSRQRPPRPPSGPAGRRGSGVTRRRRRGAGGSRAGRAGTAPAPR